MKKRFCLLFIFLFLPPFLFPISVSANKDMIVDSYDSLYEEIAEDILEWEEESVFYLSFEPKKIEIEEIREKVETSHYISSHNFYGFSYRYERVGKVYEMRIEYKKYMNEKEYAKVKEECEKIAKELEGKNDYEKIKYAHDYLILVCDYSIIHNGPYNCLFKRKAACNGYMLAFQMIMDECDIPCRCVTNIGHGWNIIYLDGYWYNIDVTWDDMGKDGVRYDFFLKNNKDFPDHEGASEKATAVVSYELCEETEQLDVKAMYFKNLIVIYLPFVLVLVFVGLALSIYAFVFRKKET